MSADMKSEAPKLRDAVDHFGKAKAAFDLTAKSCAQFRTQWKDEEKVALMDRDIKGFQHMSQLMQQIVSETDSGNKIPSMESVHQAMSDIGDTLVYAKYRAQAHRGMKGHYPQ